MAEFKHAFAHALKFEDSTLSGEVTVDAGGRTRFGIAERFHPELGDSFFCGSADEALAEAERIEQSEYWGPLSLADVSSQEVANKLFDMGVNMGVRQAAVFAQRAANALFGDGSAHAALSVDGANAGAGASAAMRLVEDGAIGPRTLAAINSLDPERYLTVLRELSAEFYRHVASINPAQAKNLSGWLVRAET
jgi:lysozyme family protein